MMEQYGAADPPGPPNKESYQLFSQISALLKNVIIISAKLIKHILFIC